MSPLMIILLVLILVIGSAHRNAAEKYSTGVGNQSLPGSDELNASLLLDHVNDVTFNVDGSEADPSMTRRTQLRQDLQHLLSTIVKKIILQYRERETKLARDIWMKRKDSLRKTLASNKIPIGEFPEEDGWARSAEARRDSGYYKSVIGRSSLGEVPERLSKDLVQVSKTLMPSTRRIEHSRLKEVRELEVPRKTRISQGNSSEAKRSFRWKRDQPHDAEAWMTKDFSDHQIKFRMHAFIVKDEEIPHCCSPAKQVTNRRYFMCSGAVLTLKHVITSASCIHYADVHERNVEADLAVLVGDTETRPYVIKVNGYDMHPQYDYDVDSKDHATNNLAILHLACSVVPQDVVIPHFPKGVNEDVAHVCCRENCDLITIMQNSDNRHIAHIVQPKYLPAPMHDDDVDAPSYRALFNSALESHQVTNKSVFSNKSRVPARRVRSPLKLAAAPTFFGKESSRRSSRPESSVKSVESPNTKKRKKAKKQHRDGRRKKPLNFDDLFSIRTIGSARISIIRALQKEGVNVEEQLAAIDWQKVEEAMGKKFPVDSQEKMDLFAKNVVDETMKRLENVLNDGKEGNASSVIGKLMQKNSSNKTIENFVHSFTQVLSSLVSPNSDAFPNSLDMTVEEKDLQDPPPDNQECPPLGTPVIADGTLVGLVAYTCDDVQTWVEWKYVSIAKNMKWIRERTTNEDGTAYAVCVGPNRQVRMAAGDPRAVPTQRKWPRESETEIRGAKVEWKSRETTGDARRSSPTGNLDHARNPATGTYPRIPKDPWFARNSPLAPQVHPANERRRIFADSRNQPQPPTRDASGYSANSCYVNPDGSTDCRARGGFDIP